MAIPFLIIAGASREYGNTAKVADYLQSYLSEAVVVNLYGKNITYYDYQHRNDGDDFLSLAQLMTEAEHILFASPIYWYNMSAVMKTFFDRMSDLLRIHKPVGRKLRGKKMSVVSTSGDATIYPSFYESFRLSAEYLGMQYIGSCHTWIAEQELTSEVKMKIAHFANKIS